jgi:dTDP-4-dehydrorhamnose 3,5-epimerase
MLNQSDRPHSSEIIVEGLQVKTLEIPEIKIFRAEAIQDIRGEIAPTFNSLFFEKLGMDFQIIHENHCLSPEKCTIRGFHYQLPPHGQAKLIRVCQGKIIDVSIDLRKSPSTFGQHVRVELDPNGWNQIFVPEGFAH